MGTNNDEYAKLQIEYAKVKRALDNLIPAHEKLQLEHQKVVAENLKLKAGTNPVESLKPEAHMILKFLFDVDGDASGEDITRKTGLKGGLLDHHLDTLKARGFITQTTLRETTSANRFQISGDGRDWIVGSA
jgi:DNA-binding MarR family transcriptional regulator